MASKELQAGADAQCPQRLMQFELSTEAFHFYGSAEVLRKSYISMEQRRLILQKSYHRLFTTFWKPGLSPQVHFLQLFKLVFNLWPLNGVRWFWEDRNCLSVIQGKLPVRIRNINWIWYWCWSVSLTIPRTQAVFWSIIVQWQPHSQYLHLTSVSPIYNN